MKKFIFTLALVTAISTLAQANERPDLYSSFRIFGISTLQTAYSGDATSDMPKDQKQILQASDDIAYFVATGGEMRTARFETAIQIARKLSGDQKASDLDLAQAVLAELSHLLQN